MLEIQACLHPKSVLRFGMSFRRVLTVAALLLAAIVFIGQLRQLLADPTIWPPDDFVEYWAAAKLTLEGKNPYDSALLLPLQQYAGRQTDEAIMMWNPPWSLAVVLPLGLLPAREAQLLWLAVNLLAIGFCGDRLWLLCGGASNRRWAGLLVVIAALPTAFALQSGQISPLLLFGAVLFLECQRRGWQYLAGSATVLLAIKPHLAYLIWIAIGLDALARGRWRVLIGGAATGAICTVIALVFNQQVWQQYSDALANRPPAQWVSPTIGTLLRLAFGEELFRLQFVPVVLGLVWFVWYSQRYFRRNSSEAPVWDWCEQLPLLLLVSFVTAPYGAWPFDMVLLLPAVMLLVIRTEPPFRLGVIAGLVAVNIGCLALNLFKVTSFWFLWVSPAVLGIYLLARISRARIAGPSKSSARSTDSALVSA
jgi:Glycosyltransferase family 87